MYWRSPRQTPAFPFADFAARLACGQVAGAVLKIDAIK
jgi:hypothetical protein